MKILVAYKGKTVIKKHMDVAIKQAKAFNAEVIIVKSLDGEEEEIKFEQADEMLTEVQTYFEKQGVPCETHLLVRGMNPGEDILNYAEKNKIDQIVISVHNRSKLGKLIFGSTAQEIILKARCPVLVVK